MRAGFIFFLTLSFLFFGFGTPSVHAAGATRVVFKTDFSIWKTDLDPSDFSRDYSKAVFLGYPIVVSPENKQKTDPFISVEVEHGFDLSLLQNYLDQRFSKIIFRPREDVTIRMENDHPVFEGRGLYGRSLDSWMAAIVLKYALQDRTRFVQLPLIKDLPQVTVLSDELKKMGIHELVTASETDFTGSPPNRVNNVRVGLSRFNGHVIKPGEEFVFGNVLGPVDETTGYLKELVIKGDRTVPDYGGGLCQVSTTAYRAALLAGLPITDRRNHSYAVHYYEPVGLDATVYPPSTDLKFVNDLSSHLLMQTFIVGNKAYYNFYGTKDPRQVHMMGPYEFDPVPPPPDRMEYTTKLPPGQKEKLGNAVPGLKTNWYRQVVYGDPVKKPLFNQIFSQYQARPLFYAVGVQKPAEETPSSLRFIDSGF